MKTNIEEQIKEIVFDYSDSIAEWLKWGDGANADIKPFIKQLLSLITKQREEAVLDFAKWRVYEAPEDKGSLILDAEGYISQERNK